MTKKTPVMESAPFTVDQKALIDELGAEKLLACYRQMLRIRHLEQRAEAAYQQGHIGGFFHSYMGQEAIQTAAVEVFGTDSWWTTTYRCHALALLLGVTPNEIMAEFYGRVTGNAEGRGGSMHLFSDRLLGGYGIVGGQIPIGTGAAFSLMYEDNRDRASICFMGDGAVAQGSFHESLNLAALWNLPCVYVIENNQWGMGTAVDRALSVHRLAEDKAPAYGLKGYTFDGMNFFECYAGFQHVFKEMRETSRPVLVEVVTERFRGHSISDPGLYRSKEELKEAMQRDPLNLLQHALEDAGLLDEQQFNAMNDEIRQEMIAAMKFAEESPWPDPVTLEEGVFAP